MTERFWVIFDTCEYPQYYQDVHNLLAMPEGTTMRYEYKKKYLSDLAIELAEGSEELPILFIYAQRESKYIRTKDKSASPEGEYRTLFVATRLGKMLRVTKDDKSYYFDFQVIMYPNQSPVSLKQILADLEARTEVPWVKWVCISTQCHNLEAIREGDEHQKWTAIVDLLSQPPMQFAGDAFWRLKGPFGKSDESPKSSKVECYTEAGKPRQARSYYDIVENDSWRFELVSETGSYITEASEGTRPHPQYLVEGKSSDNKILSLIGSPRYSLRHYSAQMIEYQAHLHPLLGKAAADLILRTEPQSADWPSGPNLILKHRLYRNKIRMTLGVIFGILGTCSFVVGDSKLFEQQAWIGTILKAGGVLLMVLSGFVLTGTVGFKS